MDWFTVDKEGLAKVLERRGKAFVLFELMSNAWDTSATEVTVTISPVANRPYCDIVVVDDDPTGFSNLEHAFTLFAESERKGDPEKRGRFNLGEKLVLAMCEEASIASTNGCIYFDKDGRHRKQSKTGVGSMFAGRVRMTRDEYAEVMRAARTLISPHNIRTTINGEHLQDRARVEGYRVTLPTEIADSEGFLRRSRREALVQLHKREGDEPPYLYEMGIPVVELTGGEPWHVNVHQKIALNADRDNVTPAFLRELRTAMLNHMHKHLKGAEDATKAWVREAASDPDATKAAVERVKVERFGEKAVAYDPSDVEGSKRAAHEGYTVIPGGALSKGEWENLKRDRIVLPAGQVTPSKPEKTAETRLLFQNEWSEEMGKLDLFVGSLGKVLLGRSCSSKFIESPEATVLATWNSGFITFNISTLGKSWLEKGVTEEQLDLILHEMSHHFASDHLSKEFNDACTKLGAKLAFFIADHPNFLKNHTW
jgi:hypothetical protein